MIEYPYKLAIVSDLHLTEGWDENGYLSRNEDFFFDQNFERFLKYLSSKATEERIYYRLLINGDFVDFLQFTTVPDEKELGEAITKREKNVGLGTSEKKTLWKLNRLINGHKVFFSAMADFISAGNEVYIIPGNHDIEWIIPSVQEAFRDKVSTLHSNADIRSKIFFLPWFYFDPTMSVFIEHGSQYDDINSFNYFLCPYLPDGTIDLPAGSFFVRYLFNRVEETWPFADNMKPLSKFLWWSWFGFRKPSQLPKFIKFFCNTLAKRGKLNKQWALQLDARQKTEIENVSKNSKVDEGLLHAVKQHWMPSAIHTNSSLTLLKSFKDNSKLDKHYYRQRAKAVQEMLKTRYVVFGHTHEADLYLLSQTQDKKNEYVNSGTWTKSFAANFEEALLKSENEFVYVHIGYDQQKNRVKMDLLRWNDSLGDGERVRLFKKPRNTYENARMEGP